MYYNAYFNVQDQQSFLFHKMGDLYLYKFDLTEILYDWGLMHIFFETDLT